MRRKNTVENLMTWAPLGAGLALMLSDHRRLGMAVALMSPATVAWRHPRGTRRALRAIPDGFGTAARESARGLRWLAS